MAGTDNGNDIFWVTEGLPDAWSVAVMESRGSRCYWFDGGIVAFLVAAFQERITCPMFPEFPTTKPVVFRPFARGR